MSIDSTVAVNGVDFRENLLFTHRGLTGPSVLQASSYLPDVIQEGQLRIDLLPNDSVESLFPIPNQEPRSIGNVLATVVAKRFVQAWTQHDLTRRVDQTSLADLTEIIEAFKHWEVRPVDTEGYLKAEVTRGGDDTNVRASKTMECTSVPGLFFIGEVVDVTGWLGGYNFQWAWSSGYAAGLAV